MRLIIVRQHDEDDRETINDKERERQRERERVEYVCVPSINLYSKLYQFLLRWTINVIWLLTRGGDDGWETLFCLICRITVSVRRGALSIAIAYFTRDKHVSCYTIHELNARDCPLRDKVFFHLI